jgi:hypothetical protein
VILVRRTSGRRGEKPYFWPRDAWTYSSRNWDALRSYGFPEVEDPLEHLVSLEYDHAQHQWLWGIHRADEEGYLQGNYTYLLSGKAVTRAGAKEGALEALNSGALTSAEQRNALRDAEWE